MIGKSSNHFVKKNHFVPILAYVNLVVPDARVVFRKFVELVIVRGKQCPRTDSLMEIFRQSPRDADAVERACAAADLVQQNEAPRGRCVDNMSGLVHLHKERALTGCNVVAGTHACEDLVDDSYFRCLCGNVAAYLRTESDRAHLTKITGLS